MKKSGWITFCKFYAVFVTIYCLQLIISGCGMESTPVSIQKTDKLGHDIRIDEDQTWSADNGHVITREVVVDNATLTIEPGAVIEFKANAALRIKKGAALQASGTKADSIHFKTYADSVNKWDFIVFENGCNDQSCRLEYCVIENGGANDSIPAMIVIENASPTIQNCRIQNSASHGILAKGESELTYFTNNTVTQNAYSPLLVPVTSVSTLNPNNSFTGNGQDAILISEAGEFFRDEIWKLMNVPYHLKVDLAIKEYQLKLESGVELLIDSQKGIDVGYNAALVAEGTSNLPVRFAGLIAEKGSWKGIYLKDSSLRNASRFAYCEFVDAGSDPIVHSNGIPVRAAVFCEYVNPSFLNCTFMNSAGYGIVFDRGSIPAKFENNEIMFNADAPILLHPEALNLPKTNQFHDNAVNYIEVVGGVISSGGIITNCQIPYRLAGELSIYYNIVRIEPGVIFEMTDQASISVSANGGLIADGITKGQEIMFTGIYEYPGAWKYIYFGPDCNEAFCKLNYCIVQYGGGDIGWPANIFLEGASPQITNSVIANSKHWGIFKSNNADPNLADTVFEGNIDGDVWP